MVVTTNLLLPGALQSALASEDATAIEQVAASFPGTPAAHEAALWLGDRDLVLGQFAQAWQRYESAGAHPTAGYRIEHAARLRMAGALLGHEVGVPVTQSVAFGEQRLTAEEFESTIADLLEHRQGQTSHGGLTAKGWVPAPPIANYQAETLTDFPHGTRGWHHRPGAEVDVDWMARSLAMVPTSAGWLISNRLGLGLLDEDRKGQKWYREFGRTRGYPPTWIWAPMNPLVVGDATYSRRVTKVTPRLQHSDLEGRSRWSTGEDWAMLTDPMLSGGNLVLLSAFYKDQLRDRRRSMETWQVFLTRLNPADGAVVEKLPLIEILDRWDGVLPCQAALLENNRLVASVGGVVLSCDLQGRVYWGRQQEVEPEGPQSLVTAHARPLVVGDRLLVTQTSMPGLECLETASGRLIWKFAEPGVLRIAGMLDDLAVLETTTGLTALDGKSGEVRWRRELPHLSEATLTGGPGRLVCIVQKFEAGQRDSAWTPHLLWLDPANGETQHDLPLAELRAEGRTPHMALMGPWYHEDDSWYVFYDTHRRRSEAGFRTLVRLHRRE